MRVSLMLISFLGTGTVSPGPLLPPGCFQGAPNPILALIFPPSSFLLFCQDQERGGSPNSSYLKWNKPVPWLSEVRDSCSWRWSKSSFHR